MQRLGLALCALAFAMVLMLVVEKWTETNPYQGGVISRGLLHLMESADVRRGRQAEEDLRQALEDRETDVGCSREQDEDATCEGQVILEKPIHQADPASP